MEVSAVNMDSTSAGSSVHGVVHDQLFGGRRNLVSWSTTWHAFQVIMMLTPVMCWVCRWIRAAKA